MIIIDDDGLLEAVSHQVTAEDIVTSSADISWRIKIPDFERCDSETAPHESANSGAQCKGNAGVLRYPTSYFQSV